jgi:hypothetical protein
MAPNPPHTFYRSPKGRKSIRPRHKWKKSLFAGVPSSASSTCGRSAAVGPSPNRFNLTSLAAKRTESKFLNDGPSEHPRNYQCQLARYRYSGIGIFRGRLPQRRSWIYCHSSPLLSVRAPAATTAREEGPARRPTMCCVPWDKGPPYTLLRRSPRAGLALFVALLPLCLCAIKAHFDAGCEPRLADLIRSR